MTTWSVILGNSVATSGVDSAVIEKVVSGLVAAGEDWERYFVTADTNIEITLEIAETASNRSTGGPISSVFVEDNGQHSIFLNGAAAKLIDGFDVTKGDPIAANNAEILITIDPLYFAEIDLDDTPLIRTDEIATLLVDAQSVFLHEIGHGLGFDGFVNIESDLLSLTNISVFDSFVEFQNGVPFFTGAAANNIYGSDVPLTQLNTHHVGNVENVVGSDLIPDVMNGVVFFRETRYYISPLDTAILADTGLTLRVPTENADEIWGYESVDDNLNLLAGNDVFHGLSGDDTAKGGSGKDTLFGENGDDTLDGGGGGDTLSGGNGDDILKGKGGQDIINGGEGNDILEGHKGTDTLNGGNGDDTYTVHAKEDSADIYADSGTDGGTDTIVATQIADLLLATTFNLASAGIEVILGDGATRIVADDVAVNWDFSGVILTAIKQVNGSGQDDSLIGGDSAEKIKGRGGDDVLDGGNGDDKLIGNAGDDSLTGNNGDDTIKGSSGSDLLIGNSGDDDLRGGSGRDTLNGGSGSDKLNGATGKDTFVFDTNLEASNIDTIVNWNAADDVIALDDDIFTLLTSTAGNLLSASEFKANSSGIADEADDRIIYNSTTGDLFYDADGVGGVERIQFAQITDASLIDADSFLVIA
ncbi:MAG: Ca2+-binding RTX toxin-like protein [Gammaproteobacteria bacterium]|jgi:Ca2+-binding RTX toxin-like protein